MRLDDELRVLAKNHQIKNPLINNVCGTEYVPHTGCIRSAYAAAYAAAYADFAGNPESLFPDPFRPKLWAQKNLYPGPSC